MCHFFVISVHKAHNVFLIKGTDVYPLFVVQAINKICIFDNQHPFSLTFVYKIISQTSLVISRKCVLGICAKLTVIRGVKKYEIVFTRLNRVKKIFKVQIVYS